MKQQGVFRRLVVNSGTLFAGDAASSLFGLLSLVLMARVLGPEQLGILAAIQAYVSTVGVLVNFQSWHAIVSYGARALADQDTVAFERLIRVGTLLDLISALVGAVVAALVAVVVGPLLSWDAATTRLAALFCVTIALDLSGTPKGVLRMFDRFGQLSSVTLLTAGLKCAAVAVAAFFQAGLDTFVVITGAAIVLDRLLLCMLGWRVLIQRGHGGALRRSSEGFGDAPAGLWPFVWTTNASSSLGIVTRELDILIVAGVLGPSSAGLYRVARQFAALLSRPFEALYHAVYPELAQLWTQGEVLAFRQLRWRGAAGAGVFALLVWCVLWLFGEPLLARTVGSDYVAAHAVLLWYALALVVGVAAFALEPAGYSMGRSKPMLVAHAGSVLLYVVILPPFLLAIGLPGAGVAALVFQLSWAAAMLFVQRAR